MDYTLTSNSNGSADLSFAKSTGLFVNVYLSLTIVKGSWWFDPEFGLARRSRLKNTPATADLIAQDCRSALQWLLDTGRATSITVEPTMMPDKPTWLNVHCSVVTADGNIVTYDKFIEVV